MIVLIYIYIYIYYDGSQYKDILYIYEVFDDKYWWVTSHEIVVRIIYLKGFFPHPNVSEFHLLSYLTPPPHPFLFPITDTLEGLLE